MALKELEAQSKAAAETATAQLAAKTKHREDKDRRDHRKKRTHERRRRIVRENLDKDPEVWNRINVLLTRLDVGGMSGDETDSPISISPKRVRRVNLPWRSHAISQLFNAVESYEGAARAECLAAAIGNHRFAREFASLKEDQNSKPLFRLPRNWYNDQWVQSMSSSTQQLCGLDTTEVVEIPTLPHYGSTICD
ncbi:hypothetical protein BJ138DRAFT_1119181 [Hygrophoropsis aurantiaca]|uniref:Uncharacterized protein n=1 Tax=Hygrophoropsis aurantiaca TaxID=72124 RepID=A0ACB7ZUZ4_9AGAM|nr:hypothetical protein BJ138DRAFT_1119181 [Hygrophoropsis aurantiaca]